MTELLSPVGNFECLQAAVQNGADSVYFGADLFSARAFASNFDDNELKKAIEYAKIRGVKTNLTLNTLIKDNEFEEAFALAKNAYQYGIDAIIVQDLGLARKLIQTFPDLPIHGSTQMTIHNLNGALELQELGFKRVVLSRELSANEIEYICSHTDLEIECFVHGALCISYSGQCLFSSMIGGRSGNRGKCAQPCRLPYELLENGETTLDSGYLLSTRDLCALDYIPFFLQAGVSCLKIEGRMKSPEYVAIVTRIYRKYIDMALSDEPYVVDDQDRKDLLQVFNRGMSSCGHLDKEPNRNLVGKEKPNNMGLFLGTIQKYNAARGLITLKVQEPIKIGDTIAIENETGSYTVSELMDDEKNISETKLDQLVTIGRMKGNIAIGHKVYKMSSKALNKLAKESYAKEFRRIGLLADVTIQKGKPISIHVASANSLPWYQDLAITYELDEFPVDAINRPLDEISVKKQLSKTSSTPYDFKQITVHLDDGLFLPKLSVLNELRRNVLEQAQEYILSRLYRQLPEGNLFSKEDTLSTMREYAKNKIDLSKTQSQKISVLLNELHLDYDYSQLNNIDSVYIPLKYFTQRLYEPVLTILSQKFDTYIYMPSIIKGNYKNLFYTNAESSVQKYDIKGFVVSNLCNIRLLNDLFTDLDKYFKLVANYTFNVYNSHTVLELKKLGISQFVLSPELDKDTIRSLCDYQYLQKEMIVYGNVPLMTLNYCLIGNSNKCFPECKAPCMNKKRYYLKDRLQMKFRMIADNLQTVTTIYNCKTTSILPSTFLLDVARVDILEESIEEINSIVETIKSGKRFEGNNFTNGNVNREI